jgi:hypothetical protein
LSTSIRVIPGMPPMYTSAMAIRPTPATMTATSGLFTVELVENIRAATMPTEASAMTRNMPKISRVRTAEAIRAGRSRARRENRSPSVWPPTLRTGEA